MNAIEIRHDVPLPTDEQTILHIQIATVVMGWPVVEKLFDPEGRNAPVVYQHEHHGCLKGTPFLSWGLYDHSFRMWSPSTDPAAAAELRERLVFLNWQPIFCYERQGWTCILSHKDMPSPESHTTAPTLEESLVLGAIKVAKYLAHPA